MRFAFAIVCSLLLILGQAVAASVVTGATAVDCGCGGQMACCQKAQVPQTPTAATVVASSQIQMVSPVPAVVIWTLTTVGTFSISPTVSPSLTADVAPLFARNCSRLI